MDYLPFADASPECHVILAHLGNAGDILGAKDPTHHVQASRRHALRVDRMPLFQHHPLSLLE
jgi:hypothetical protein